MALTATLDSSLVCRGERKFPGPLLKLPFAKDPHRLQIHTILEIRLLQHVFDLQQHPLQRPTWQPASQQTHLALGNAGVENWSFHSDQWSLLETVFWVLHSEAEQTACVGSAFWTDEEALDWVIEWVVEQGKALHRV